MMEPAMNEEGFTRAWVISREEYEGLPDEVKGRWTWEVVGGIATGHKKQPVDYP